MKFALLLLLSLPSLTAPGPSIDGVKIVTRQVSGGFTDTRTEYLAADRLRNEWLDRLGDRPGIPMASIVLRGERDKVFVLDLQSHEYVGYETDFHGTALGVRPIATKDSGGTLQVWISYIDTGERKEFFGRTARRVITREKRIASPGACSTGSESETDGWYLDPSVMPEWRRAKKDAFGIVVMSVISAGPAGKCIDKMDKIEVHRAGSEPGFPVKVSTMLKSEAPGRPGAPKTVESVWGSEVVELKAGPLDASLFEVPPDFRRVASLRSWASAVPPRRQLSGWEWLREKIQELFR